MTATESLLPEIINDFFNKIGTELPIWNVRCHGEYWGQSGHIAGIAKTALITRADIRHRVRQSSLTGRGVISDQAARVSPNAQCGSVPASQADRKGESAHQNEADGPSCI